MDTLQLVTGGRQTIPPDPKHFDAKSNNRFSWIDQTCLEIAQWKEFNAECARMRRDRSFIGPEDVVSGYRRLRTPMESMAGLHMSPISPRGGEAIGQRG
jgi:hypothetical protein